MYAPDRMTWMLSGVSLPEYLAKGLVQPTTPHSQLSSTPYGRAFWLMLIMKMNRQLLKEKRRQLYTGVSYGQMSFIVGSKAIC
jgi:hypothetical protein